MSEKIEINYLTPVIATFSAGKTSFLDAVPTLNFWKYPDKLEQNL